MSATSIQHSLKLVMKATITAVGLERLDFAAVASEPRYGVAEVMHLTKFGVSETPRFHKLVNNGDGVLRIGSPVMH